ncbi:winged helix-turn-helix domain-containing protein [Sporosalibacterium faouarense]|uniref:winged helix-turn-helix domain-containing protein n=1 Tax=Sporosalibacterium faouarense TaxID=516123 RepID=UPI00141C8D64|nr:winged helix-turn-helix domain-containing protein [Sporosalibacterium faouarense]MTI47507.1 helix-turn-helix transcriptional regulator [Bacillota bacterium]
MEKSKTLTTLEQIKVFSDSYRLQILYKIKSFKRPAMVKEIADKMGETPAKVHYHVKKMEKAGILQLSHTKEINGIIAKYYELTAETFSLKYSDTNPEIDRLVKSEFQRVVDSMYNESKEFILKQIENSYNLNDSEDDKSEFEDISLSNIYLTKEEANELMALIKKYKGKNRDRKNDKDINKYHFFTVFFSHNKDDKAED